MKIVCKKQIFLPIPQSIHASKMGIFPFKLGLHRKWGGHPIFCQASGNLQE